MKSIMISIKPKWCAVIMNGDKTIEVRKNKALVSAIQKFIDKYGYADIYVYCSKDKPYLHYGYNKYGREVLCHSEKMFGSSPLLNGKVVFKFRCNKVEEIELNKNHFVNEQYSTYEFDYEELLEQSCLTYKELDDYLQCEIGYAVHISNLEIFDKPKELREFNCAGKKKNCRTCKERCMYYLSTDTLSGKPNSGCTRYKRLTKAPQNYCYVEVD